VKENIKACQECHKRMRVEGSLVQIPTAQQSNSASAYVDAMHGLCIGCHKKEKDKLKPPNENFDRCTQCHRHQPRLKDQVWEARR
jgi:hypothetical protein